MSRIPWLMRFLRLPSAEVASCDRSHGSAIDMGALCLFQRATSGRTNHHFGPIAGIWKLPDSKNDLYDVLLKAVINGHLPEDETTQIFFITPRPGSISPWSSKATSIAHVCGLEKVVHRIERGLVLVAKFKEPLKDGSITNKDSLYDRMTETISSQPRI